MLNNFPMGNNKQTKADKNFQAGHDQGLIWKWTTKPKVPWISRIGNYSLLLFLLQNYGASDEGGRLTANKEVILNTACCCSGI